MPKYFLIVISLCLAFQLNAQSTSLKKKAISIGEQVEFHSDILDENRLLNIYLPVGYSADSAKTYPVIYLLDGSLDEDFIHIVGLVQFGSFSWINLIPETIVVGISNVDRKRDFTYPTTNKQDKLDFPTTGGSANFIQFLEKEVQPLIAKNYKTNKSRTLIGQSLGGLLATEILFKKPDLFENFMIISPSLWWDDESLLKIEPKKFTSNKSIYVAVGKEGEIMERTATDLHHKLEKLDLKNTQLFFEYFEKFDHGDVLHMAVYRAFELIFAQQK
ncbi:MAG: alpha/beta hydrolase-fold protein [Crocinitomicaceae bacterium]